MNPHRAGSTLLFVLVLLAASLSAQPASIDTFPYTPDNTAEGADFVANYGTGPTTSGSTWTQGSVSSPRQGSSGAGSTAWACLPTSNYANNTVTWLHSPIFDFTGVSGMQLQFELWVKVRSYDGAKLQVSTNGGSAWSDVSALSVSYNGTCALIATKFGGSSNCWTGTGLGGGSASTCSVNLNAWSGQSDVRFRWCFVAEDTEKASPDNGPVVDSPRVVPVTSSVAYANGFAAVPQGETVGATITKVGGDDFVGGMTVDVAGTGVTGTVTSVNSVDEIEVDFSATRVADVGPHTFWIKNGSTNICQGTVVVYHPHQRVPARDGSVQEPPQNAAMGANGVYLHNGEFRHDLPFVSIPGRMLPLAVGGTYRSRYESLGWLGAGWTVSFDQRIYWTGSVIDVYSGSGRIDTFTLAGGGTSGVGPYTRAGFFFEITRDDNSTGGDPSDDTFTITYAHGSTATFEAIHTDVAGDWAYRITEFADRYGNAIKYVYDGDGYLTEIRGDLYDAGDPGLYRLQIAYNDHGRIETITDYADYTGQQSVIGSSHTGARVWEFIYNSDAQLTEIKLPKTERYDSETKGSDYRTRVQFTYASSSDRMEEVIDARQANETSPIGWLKNHYDGSSRVDYQDVGRTSGGDTTHRQYVIYSSIDGNGRWTADVVNAEGLRSRFQVQVQSGSYPIGTTVYVRHYTAFWNSSLSQTSGKLRSGDPDYYETTFDYDSQFNTIEVTYPRGNRSEFRYDITGDQRERGNLLRALSHPGSISTSGLPADQVNGLLATFTYTADFNLLATSVSPRGYNVGASYDITNHSGLTTDDSSRFTTTYTYFDGSVPGTLAGTLQKVTSPAVDDADSPDTLNDTQVIEVDNTYNSFGQLETVTDEAGVETTYVYGTSGFGKGYLAEIHAGSQGTALETSFTYNSVGRVITVTDPRGFTYTSYVNQLDQVVRSETPQVSYHGNAVYYSVTDYDLNGNVETSGVSNFDKSGTLQSPNVIETSYAWNILDMATSITEDIDVSTTRTTTVSYDKIYRDTETVLPEGNRSGTDFDELNRVFKTYWGYDGTAVTRASALTKTRTDYDLNSNVSRAEDGRGNDSHYHYDAYDRLIKAEDRLASDMNYTTFAYNRAGQTLETIRMGKRRTYNPGTDTYGWENDELLAKSETRYDNIGRAYFSRTYARNFDDTANLGYSAYETVPGVADGWSTSRVQFRSNGQVEYTEGDLRYQTKFEYDDYNRLEAVIDDRDGGGPDKLDDDNYDFYDYDANGNVTGITAFLYDDAGSSGNKSVATSFTYDSLNRLVEDEAPGSLTREYRYDSRGNRVFTVDRKGVERVYSYDLLDRPVRAEISDVEYRDISPSTGYVTTAVRDIVSRTVYDKNSNVKESIGPTGSRSYVRYDLAHRWLQTQYPDGGTGTPLKSSAGSGHSLTSVSGTPYFTKSGAYDGNGNLLLSTDANNTEITFTWDANDNLLEETGSAAGGNPFGILGEAGMEYEYDGLYRAGRGRTNDGSDDLTEVNSLFNTLSGIERQQQIVYDAHPGLSTPYTSTGSVQSWFDESGRRYQRQNPSDVTRTAWHFDRKHRPVETWRSVNTGGSWVTDSDSISEYSYLGGGLLHSRHLKRHPQDPNRPIISEFKRDDLLRVTSVRHTRDDSTASFGQRLLGRFDTAYDENSMMLYEARWYEQDGDGSSTTPDATDFYFYDSANQLQKAVYGVTQDDTGAAAPLDLSSIHWPNVNTNNVTHSDRVIYSRRHTGTRDRVNWYRGSADPTDPIPGQFDESSTAPTQKTDYDTSDDPGADPDNPASDGEGSRHNYTEIGNVGLTYDNNRNLTADGTRQFRYNYRNQLRKVWRKSDGDSDGLVSQYREDAFGRRVLTHSWWELARRVYLDTRFELDIDMDADGDSTSLEYINGGITSTASAPISHPHQLAEWESRIYRTHATLESHYYDFLVYVPDVDVGTYTGDVYRGMLGVGEYELLIFHDRYELWDFTGSPTLLDTSYATTSGWHNIGLRAGIDAGVWVDGSQIMTYGVGLYINEKVKFGTLYNLITYQDGENFYVVEAEGIELYENLNYLRSYNRSQADMTQPAGGGEGGYPQGGTPSGTPFDPSTSLVFCDGPQVITAINVFDNGSGAGDTAVEVDYEGDATRARHEWDDGVNSGEFTDIYLVDTRRGTACIVRDNADSMVNDEGTLVEDTENGPHPGVAISVHHDAVGAVTTVSHPDTTGSRGPWPGIDSNNLLSGYYETNGIPLTFGVSTGAEGDGPSSPDAGIFLSSVVTVPPNAAGDKDEGEGNSDNGNCECRCNDASNPVDVVDYGESNVGTIQSPVSAEPPRYYSHYWEAIANWFAALNVGAGVVRSSLDGLAADLDIGYEDARREFQFFRAALSTTHKSSENYGLLIARLAALADVLDEMERARKALAEARAEEWQRFESPEALAAKAKARQDWIDYQNRKVFGEMMFEMTMVFGACLTANVGALGSVGSANRIGSTNPGSGRTTSSHGGARSGTGSSGGSPKPSGSGGKPGGSGGRTTASTAGNCFVAGTLVWVLRPDADADEAEMAMRTGEGLEAYFELLPIEQVKKGTLVLSRPQEDDEAPLTLARVAYLCECIVDVVVELAIIDPRSQTVGIVRTTQHHRYWAYQDAFGQVQLADPTADESTGRRVYDVDERGHVRDADEGWTFTTHLRPGQGIATESSIGGVVAGQRHISAPGTKVYTFAVAGTATYFVAPASTDEQPIAIWSHNNSKPGTGGNSTQTPGKSPKRHTADQEALKDLVEGATNRGRKPLKKDDAETVLDWADEVDFPGRRAGENDVTGNHPGTEWDGKPHIHLPGVGDKRGHIPVASGVNPR